ncbi:uncharacterized protein ARMOST_20978 [Armillaria ostoyae]|uniref:Uncharacterized protein n=1 Tax=Armillaria ostoyae TaxID=47428 RepID=A0A284S8V3_ARMOS|nr:uncharacterized protein ARMOST_20978 [Armillaria ostoyae]
MIPSLFLDEGENCTGDSKNLETFGQEITNRLSTVDILFERQRSKCDYSGICIFLRRPKKDLLTFLEDLSAKTNQRSIIISSTVFIFNPRPMTPGYQLCRLCSNLKHLPPSC